jgi:hypothetical protein
MTGIVIRMALSRLAKRYDRELALYEQHRGLLPPERITETRAKRDLCRDLLAEITGVTVAEAQP